MKYYELKGNFQQAGDIKKKLAETCESDKEIKQAIEHYQKAVDYYEMESSANTKVSIQTCLLKTADLMCETDHDNAFTKSKEVIIDKYYIFTSPLYTYFIK